MAGTVVKTEEVKSSSDASKIKTPSPAPAALKEPVPAPSSTGSKRQQPTPSSTGSKKRPYRRTKRPKNYCDKSTVTTTTPTAETPVNVFDAVLGECEDLLRASLEAQSLGRLKMASAYQLLLHTRLVGLGKRFDRSNIAAPPRRRTDDDEDYDDDDDNEDSGMEGPDIGLAMQGRTSPTSAVAETPVKRDNEPSPDPRKGIPPELAQLTTMLPSNLEMDASMMEHLARAAVELHHQRTGRKKSADGLLASPMTGLIGSMPPSADTKVAWSQAEQDLVTSAVKEKKAPYAIAKLLPSKTETQVKAYLKNQQKTAQTSALADEMASPNSKKRGGRGRKPPTTAMNTVPNANLDAKSLLRRALENRK